MADYSSLDIRQRSASTETPPEIRRQVEVAKLIDVSKCIGCKACQSACEEWNDLRDDIGINRGVYDNPHDLTPKSWTLMRFTEYENPETQNLEWLIRKDGCMHCADPGCLKACPAPGAIVKYANGIVDFNQDHCIGCGYCFYACPFGAPQYPRVGNFGGRGKMDKCTYCAGGPQQDNSQVEYIQYGSNRIAEGKLPLCAEMCSTKALLAGDGEMIAEIYKQRVIKRGYGSGAWGWKTAYRETVAI